MSDTTFQVHGDDEKRLGSIYVRNPETAAPVPDDRASRYGIAKPAYFSGGGGLVSSAPDYLRFAEFLRRRGELHGSRLLAPRTVDYMTRNHLPGNVDCASFGLPLLPANPEPDLGQGYGLGLGVIVDAVAAKTLASEGSYGWAGAASTYFWVDPKEQLTYMFLTQFFPFGEYPIDRRLAQLVYQAIVEDIA